MALPIFNNQNPSVTPNNGNPNTVYNSKKVPADFDPLNDIPDFMNTRMVGPTSVPVPQVRDKPVPNDPVNAPNVAPVQGPRTGGESVRPSRPAVRPRVINPYSVTGNIPTTANMPGAAPAPNQYYDTTVRGSIFDGPVGGSTFGWQGLMNMMNRANTLPEFNFTPVMPDTGGGSTPTPPGTGGGGGGGTTPGGGQIGPSNPPASDVAPTTPGTDPNTATGGIGGVSDNRDFWNNWNNQRNANLGNRSIDLNSFLTPEQRTAGLGRFGSTIREAISGAASELRNAFTSDNRTARQQIVGLLDLALPGLGTAINATLDRTPYQQIQRMDLGTTAQELARQIIRESGSQLTQDIREGNNTYNPASGALFGLGDTNRIGQGLFGYQLPGEGPRVDTWDPAALAEHIRDATRAGETEDFVRSGGAIAPQFGYQAGSLGSGIGRYMAPSVNQHLRGHTMANGRVGGFYDEFGNEIDEMTWRMRNRFTRAEN